MEESFGVYAYVYDGDFGTQEANYMKNEEVLYKGNGQWSTANTFSTPEAGKKIRMYACSPFSTADNTVVSQPAAVEGAPTVTVTVPTDVKLQVDFMTASFNEMTTDDYLTQYAGEDPTAIPMTFEHQLTQIRFVTGLMPACKVSSIKLSGVKDQGTYTLGSETPWTVSGETTKDYELTGEIVVTGEAGQELNEGANRLMLVPQDPEGYVVTLKYNDGKEQELTATIPAGSDWLPGKIVTYTLSVSSIKAFKVQCTAIDNWVDGGTATGGVSSDSNIGTNGEVETWEETDEPTKITKKTE